MRTLGEMIERPEVKNADVYDRQRAEIAQLKRRTLRMIQHRARMNPHYCSDCGQSINRHAAQTEDGRWHHLGCISKCESPEYNPNGNNGRAE